MHALPAIAATSYLLGSIPFGFLLVLLFRKQDIRAQGSGNIGATNVVRSGAKWLGAFTFLLDAGKGCAAVLLAEVIVGRLRGAPPREALALAVLCAIAGHVFPVWLGFKGGKGVATAFGGFLAFDSRSALASFGVFLAVAVLTRYVSAASILAAAALPFFALWFVRESAGPPVRILIAACSALVIARHWQNMLRLARGSEHRFGQPRPPAA
jgi:glycerol-3-phosphate acyltransferase PlsY